MSMVDEIQQLLDQGNYLKAAGLIDNLKMIDCRSICQNLEINEIVDSIDHSVSILDSLETKISDYVSKLENVKEAASQMEQREQAVQVQCKNLSDTCDLIRDLIDKLTIPGSVQRTLFEGDLNDETTIERMEAALETLERIIQFSSFQDMRYVKEQKLLANSIKENYTSKLVMLERNFSYFMNKQLTSIRDYKPPKQSKCGVLAVVKNFEQFASQIEALVKSTGIRTKDIDRWYPELVTELFKTIDKMEHSKTPKEMIRLENYYYLNDVLRSKKIPCLDAQQKEANYQYNLALNAYVTLHFGQPLKKLNDFFDGVQQKIAEGVKEEEISYQLDFSKQKLRERLQMVSLKEVRKGLEEMYRRIEKDVYDPNSSSSLIQVIWRAMQTEFLSQYEKIQRMIERCYPSTSLTLTFTIEDLLQVFSDIAQSH